MPRIGHMLPFPLLVVRRYHCCCESISDAPSVCDKIIEPMRLVDKLAGRGRLRTNPPFRFDLLQADYFGLNHSTMLRPTIFAVLTL